MVLLSCGACHEEPTGTFSLTTGGETDTFTRDPKPSVLVVEDVALDGTKSEIARSPLPATEFDLGARSRTEVGSIVVRGLDEGGREILHGETLLLQFGALAGATLDVFVQRRGEFARLPEPFSSSPAVDAVVRATDRYLVTTSGVATQIYDLLRLKTIAAPPSLPRPARSLAAFETTLLVIDEEGASALDLATGATRDIAPPTSGAFAEVAGGRTVTSKDGTSFVVGPTRSTGAPTRTILRVSPEGALSFVQLATARLGACATWATEQGLVVAGGASSGPGLERVDASTSAVSSIAFEAIDVVGCSLSAPAKDQVMLAGGTLPSATFVPISSYDLGCPGNCKPTIGALSVPLARAEAVALGPTVSLVVGDDATGTTRAYRASLAEVVEIPLRVPRTGARLIAMPTGGAAVVGGAREIEQYRDRELP